MNKENKILIIFYIFLIISFSLIIIYFHSLLINNEILDILPRPIKHLEYEKTLNVEQKKIFQVMADVENYPLVLPKNVLDVKIIEKGENYVIAEETISEQGIQTILKVKHTFIFPEQHSIRILSGDAKDTLIITKFSSIQNQTKIHTDVDLNLDGILKPFSFIPKRSLNHAIGTTLSSFEQYAQGFDSKYDKIVDDLYREILLRPADELALSHYPTQLEQQIISVSQLRDILENSFEKKILEKSYEELISKLNSTTKDTINGAYQNLLHRDADPHGMAYYGTLLQNNEITIEEIENIMFESEEGFKTRVDSNEKEIVEGYYQEIFSRHATVDELEYYATLLLSGNMTKIELREKLLELNNTETIDSFVIGK